ncbi:MAG TPA: hypothetical protein VN706_24425 [Gemmatimonadaceae bacterium]|nr:hypothetical protein [Gemmatimonadaceae bacterium]
MAAVLCALAPKHLSAQTPASDPRVHPELVDSTWGPRTLAVWEIAWAGDWERADEGFAALQREEPDAIEPLLGRGFVARGVGRLSEARAWYRAALAHEPSLAEARSALALLAWERPWSLDVSGGGARIDAPGRPGGAVTGVEGNIEFTGELTSVVTVLARVGALAAGDPTEGVVLRADPLASTRASVVGAGVVVHPTTALWMTARMEEWSTPQERATFLWTDAAYRLASRVTLLAGIRPISGANGATQFSLGAATAIADRQTLTLVATRGVEPSPLEARGQLRAFWERAPARPFAIRLGVVRDLDDRLSATTAVAGATAMITPWEGLRVELASRTGAYSRRSMAVGLIVRW